MGWVKILWRYKKIAKEEVTIPDEDLEDINTFEDDTDSDEPEYVDPESVSSSLQLAALIAKPSEVLTNFPEITKEQRNAFFDEGQVKELRHRHKAYVAFQYIRKILKLQQKEDQTQLDNRRKIFEVKTPEELADYFRDNSKSYIYKELTRQYDEEVLIEDLKQIDKDCIDEDICNITDNVKEMYEEYAAEYFKPEYIDDTGNLASMQAESILSAGKGGNERYAGITSIGATRDIDLKDKIKKDTEYSPLQKFIKRFR